MLQVNNKTKIYIACAAAHAAGGVESLHQLCDALRNQGYEAFMYYIPDGVEDPIHDNYKKYSIQFANKVIDRSENIFIVPEVATYLLYRFKRIQKVIHWLSVDNYYVSLKLAGNAPKNLRYWVKSLIGYNKVFKIEQGSQEAITHFSQSRYAIEHLKRFGIGKVWYIPDYIHGSFGKGDVDSHAVRKNIVLYNPLKGFEVTKKLMEIGSDLEWIPLENLTPQQVVEVLRNSKVYIDFGNHPGKDRFPREAALSGCCVITGKSGSAFFDDDVQLPPKFKFDDDQHEDIIAAVRDCLHDYEGRIKEFSGYLHFINEHENQLNKKILEVFVRKS